MYLQYCYFLEVKKISCNTLKWEQKLQVFENYVKINLPVNVQSSAQKQRALCSTFVYFIKQIKKSYDAPKNIQT